MEARLAQQLTQIQQLMLDSGSAIVRRLVRQPHTSPDLGYRTALRFFHSDAYQMDELQKELCKPIASEDRVLIILDTSLFNFDKLSGKLKVNDPKIGYLNKEAGVGFGFHAALVVSCATGLPLYAGAFEFIVRPFGRACIPHKARPAGERESAKWLRVLRQARQGLPKTCEAIVICDREADIYDFLVETQSLPNTCFVVRMAQNRRLLSSEFRTMAAALEALPVVGHYRTAVREKGDLQAREACLGVSFGTFDIAPPVSEPARSRAQGVLRVNVVRIKEVDGDLEWKLLTNLPVKNLEDAVEIAKYYLKRWLIEESFRVMKTTGLQVESSHLESGEALQRLTAIAYTVAIMILILKQGRELNEKGSLDRHFSPRQIMVLQLLAPKVQGRSGKQLNPYAPDSLAWAVWIIARLGGWKPGDPKRPPGVMALYRGWLVFTERLEGFLLAFETLNKKVP